MVLTYITDRMCRDHNVLQCLPHTAPKHNVSLLYFKGRRRGARMREQGGGKEEDASRKG